MPDLSEAVEAVKNFHWWNYGLDEVNDTQSDDWAHALVDEIAPLITAGHNASGELMPTPAETVEPYDTFTVTRQALQIADPAPARAIFTIELVAQMQVAGSDLLYCGHYPNGDTVNYRIVGWDTQHKCLIGELEIVAAATDA